MYTFNSWSAWLMHNLETLARTQYENCIKLKHSKFHAHIVDVVNSGAAKTWYERTCLPSSQLIRILSAITKIIPCKPTALSPNYVCVDKAHTKYVNKSTLAHICCLHITTTDTCQNVYVCWQNTEPDVTHLVLDSCSIEIFSPFQRQVLVWNLTYKFCNVLISKYLFFIQLNAPLTLNQYSDHETTINRVLFATLSLSLSHLLCFTQTDETTSVKTFCFP